jgi:hypothetical protein
MIVMLVTALLHVPARAASSLPNDVTAFRAQRDRCDHFRGEDSDDPERRKFLVAQQQQYCTGTDAQLLKLKRKYGKKRSIRKILNRYDARIE